MQVTRLGHLREQTVHLPTGSETDSESSRRNPTFENAVEHSWPLIFGCDDHKMARRCGDQTWKVAECQCFDEEAP